MVRKFKKTIYNHMIVQSRNNNSPNDTYTFNLMIIAYNSNYMNIHLDS